METLDITIRHWMLAESPGWLGTATDSPGLHSLQLLRYCDIRIRRGEQWRPTLQHWEIKIFVRRKYVAAWHLPVSRRLEGSWERQLVNILCSLSRGQPGDSAHNDRRRSLMDQLTYRSGKWDIINVTLNNNILIYCAAPTAHRAQTQISIRGSHCQYNDFSVSQSPSHSQPDGPCSLLCIHDNTADSILLKFENFQDSYF